MNTINVPKAEDYTETVHLVKLPRKNANAAIAAYTKAAHDMISQAERIADAQDLTFSFSLEYGMGGTYYPEGWNDSGCEWDDSSSEAGWVSSSANC